MAIDLHEPPAEPVWPADVRVRALEQGDDLRPIWEAQQAIFPEAPQGFDEWVHEYAGGGGLDPTLWFVAEDDDGWAGFALCIPELAEDPTAGYVNELGVRPDRRGHGLGLALLRRTFVEFHARGKRRVALHVDVEQPDRGHPPLHEGGHEPRSEAHRLGEGGESAGGLIRRPTGRGGLSER